MAYLQPDILTAIGLLLDLVGALFLARGLFISKARAIELTVARFARDKAEQNLKHPAAQDRLAQSRNGVLGVIFLGMGLCLQLIATLLPPRREPAASLDALSVIESLSMIALLFVTLWYAMSTAHLRREMQRQARIQALAAEMAAHAALAQVPFEEGKSKRRVQQLVDELDRLTAG